MRQALEHANPRAFGHVTRPARRLAVLLLIAACVQSCSHARRSATTVDLSGTWAGEATGTVYMPRGASWRGSPPAPFHVQLTLQLVDSAGRVSGTADLVIPDHDRRPPPPLQVSGSIQERRVKLLLEFTNGLTPVTFEGTLAASGKLQGKLSGSGLIVSRMKLTRP